MEAEARLARVIVGSQPPDDCAPSRLAIDRDGRRLGAALSLTRRAATGRSATGTDSESLSDAATPLDYAAQIGSVATPVSYFT